MMSKIYCSAVYSNLIALRKRLAEAYIRNDSLYIAALCSQIDKLQLSFWMRDCQEPLANPSEEADLLDLCAQ